MIDGTKKVTDPEEQVFDDLPPGWRWIKRPDGTMDTEHISPFEGEPYWKSMR